MLLAIETNSFQTDNLSLNLKIIYDVLCVLQPWKTGNILMLIYHLQKYTLWIDILPKKTSYMQSFAQLCSDFGFQLLVLFVEQLNINPTNS